MCAIKKHGKKAKISLFSRGISYALLRNETKQIGTERTDQELSVDAAMTQGFGEVCLIGPSEASKSENGLQRQPL